MLRTQFRLKPKRLIRRRKHKRSLAQQIYMKKQRGCLKRAKVLKGDNTVIFESYLYLNIILYMDFPVLCCFCLVESCGGVWVKLITLYLPEPYLKALQGLVDGRYYPNRAEAIRVAIRDLLNDEAWRKNASG